MNFVVSLLQILLAAVCHLSTVKAASIKAMDQSKNEVIPLLEVMKKSVCQPREMLVDIFQEYREDTEYIYQPSCVVLTRCGGCCSDEALECVPTETRNVTLEVMRLRLRVVEHTLQLKFTEHSKCECRPKQGVITATTTKKYHCAPCSERRKRLYVQDPLTCQCSCKYSQLDCKSRQLELNERTCRCERPRR